MLFKSKKGIIMEEVMTIILTLIFFSILAIFIYNSSQSQTVYEQSLSKRIGLSLSMANPGMEIFINLQDELDKFDKDSPKEVVEIKDNRVIVSFGSSEGKSFKYFTDADVSLSENGVILIIKVEDKENEKDE